MGLIHDIELSVGDDLLEMVGHEFPADVDSEDGFADATAAR